MKALRDIHWLNAVVAMMIANAMPTFATHDALASDDLVLISDACRARMNLADDGHEHDGIPAPAEKFACCLRVCVDLVQPLTAPVIVARIQSPVGPSNRAAAWIAVADA